MKEMEDPFTSQVVCSWCVSGSSEKEYGATKMEEEGRSAREVARGLLLAKKAIIGQRNLEYKNEKKNAITDYRLYYQIGRCLIIVMFFSRTLSILSVPMCSHIYSYTPTGYYA